MVGVFVDGTVSNLVLWNPDLRSMAQLDVTSVFVLNGRAHGSLFRFGDRAFCLRGGLYIMLFLIDTDWVRG